MGQGVLEGILEIRKQPRFIEELGGSKTTEAALELFCA